MTKNPFMVNENVLATDVLNLMNKKKITGIFVHSKRDTKKTIGVIHIHDLIRSLK